jgi:(p)ppGpp synthase/HD superfamily hydrolase
MLGAVHARNRREEQMPDDRSATPMLSERYNAAFQLASEVHAHQRRKATQIPYLAHVMAVSALVMENGGDEDSAIAGLLHDAVEDSDDGEAMLEQIRSRFGERVARIVDECSDTRAIPGRDKPAWKERKEAYLRGLLTADPDTLRVSACDKLHNSRAIVADLNVVGLALFERFSSKDGADQIWYYQTLSDIYSRLLPGPLADSVRRVTARMTRDAAICGLALREGQMEWAQSTS